MELKFLLKTMEILTRLGMCDLKRAAFEQDTRNATDILGFYDGRQVSIANRTRDASIEWRQLTVRSSTYSGNFTSELEKIRSGFGDFYFYSWVTGMEITEWCLIDLQVLRETGLIDHPDETAQNHGTDEITFSCWNIDTLEEYGAVVAKGPTLQEWLQQQRQKRTVGG